MNNLLFCLNATVPVFLVMVAGYIFRRMKIVDESFVKNLNTFNFKVTLPILLIVDIASADFYEVMDIKFVLFCFFATLGSTLCITALSFLLLKDKSMLGEFIQASYRGSAAVLGMLLSFLRIPIPFIIDKTLHNFSVLATPLVLVGLGAGFEGKRQLRIYYQPSYLG